MIELVLAFQDKDGQYAEHAGVVLASVFHNTSSPVNVHILHDETLNDDNKQKLVELTTRFNHTINFYHITIPQDMLQVMAGVGSINAWTQACMYRLLLPGLIPVDKIIYLDCDVLVNMDITQLWQIDLGNYYLGAIKDQGIMEVAQIINSKGLNPDLYFNSGVVLFSLNNIRSNAGWYGETLNFFRNFPDTTMPDQDALNVVYGGNYLPLDLRYNSFSLASVDHDFTNKIVHFAGIEKCWDANSIGAELYRNYLNLTPWSEQQPQKAVEVHPTEFHPAEPHPTVVQKNRKRKSAKRYRKRIYNTASYNSLKRRARKASQGKPFKRSIKMRDRRTKISLIDLPSLRLIRPIRTNKGNPNKETGSTLYLPLRKYL
ncbi:Lipopolysaccharide biosynthesis protein, LPS:glycosyltransferase [Paenibacillus sophorae]|uniref:Glycosyltransferase family 8 protein n=1 Tax=Paenibacillus sophorae TaxID=1333845 RepID=A0A1H8MRL3_9BACL|nr:glycosyltransferase family 8 protein [Paenibacillus sophorae]QWU17916.1 glycosyltransferase family 8 protein [Paenibacillus sophorae]SEO19796.1 Lipopolysaccharide biosynthesis protein, LPS:glycosyltransferase [Paenibacillus sophorae]